MKGVCSLCRAFVHETRAEMRALIGHQKYSDVERQLTVTWITWLFLFTNKLNVERNNVIQISTSFKTCLYQVKNLKMLSNVIEIDFSFKKIAYEFKKTLLICNKQISQIYCSIKFK